MNNNDLASGEPSASFYSQPEHGATDQRDSSTIATQSPSSHNAPQSFTPSADLWSIVGYKLSTVSKNLYNVCPMSLTYIHCNIPRCPFDEHLCVDFANHGKCGDLSTCEGAHIRPSCQAHVEGRSCKPDFNSNHLKVRAHYDTRDFKDRVKMEGIRKWLEGRGIGDPEGDLE